jgi:prephenate dehydrogenase
MKIAIVGGSGKMGQWCAEFLVRNGMDVLLLGRNREKLEAVKWHMSVEISSHPMAVSSADVVLISVPMDDFEDTIKHYQPYITSQQTIIEITSVKVKPIEVMHRYLQNENVLGAHPMFGPGARDIANHNFILTPTTPQENRIASKVRAFLEARGARVSLMTPREHDETMAAVLGLPHIVALISADTLLSLGGFERFEKIGGTTCKLMLMLADSVLSEDPQLYASLQMNLPGMSEIHKLVLSKSRAWADMVMEKDREGFIEKMDSLKKKREEADPDFRKAYESMYRLEDRQV